MDEELDTAVLAAFPADTATESYMKALRAVTQMSYTGNTEEQRDYGGEIKELQQMITELQGAMRQQHDALRILRSELKVLKSEAGFI